MTRLRGNFILERGARLVAKVTQSSTNAPAMTTPVINSLPGGVVPTPTRTSAGLYPFTFADAILTAGKTFVKITSSKVTAVIPAVIYTSTTVITLSFFDAATPTAADSGDFDIEIFIAD